MLLEALLATKRKLPLESMAKAEGLKPVAVRGFTSESVPLVESTVKRETSASPSLAT